MSRSGCCVSATSSWGTLLLSGSYRSGETEGVYMSTITSEDNVLERVHTLEKGLEVQTATQGGAQATQAATQAGAQAAQAAATAGMGAAIVSGAVAFVVGLFLGITIARS